MGRRERARVCRIIDTPERRAQLRSQYGAAEAVRRIVAACHPKQRRFVTDDAREIAAIVGRGGGKTTGGRARFLRRMLLTPRARCLYIALTRSDAEELMWAPLKQLDELLDLGAHFSESKLRMTLPNGSSLRLVGADDKREIEKLRGKPFHEVQIDEAASHPVTILQHLVERIIGPRLGDFDGTLVMYGTPGHILAGEFYDATRPQSEIGRPIDEQDGTEFVWSTHHWTLLDGVEAGIPAMRKLWERALETKRKRGWSDDHPVWRREYLGLWAADETEGVFRYRPHLDDGAPWNQWDPKRDAHGFAALPDVGGEWIYGYGIDMGHSDPFALEIGAVNTKTRELRHVYEFERTGMTIRDIAELLVGKRWVQRILRGEEPGKAGGLIERTGWPYKIVADIAHLGRTVLQELAEVYGIPMDEAPRGQGEKIAAIELTNGDLIDGRIKILKGTALESQLLHMQWAVDPYGKLKEDKGQRNDCADALVYLRRAVMHLIATPTPDTPARPHSAEATEQWLQQSVDKLTAPPAQDWPDARDYGLYDDPYDFDDEYY